MKKLIAHPLASFPAIDGGLLGAARRRPQQTGAGRAPVRPLVPTVAAQKHQPGSAIFRSRNPRPVFPRSWNAHVQRGDLILPFFSCTNFDLGKKQICRMQRDQTGWTVRWSGEQQVAFTYRAYQWVGYENAKSITLKVWRLFWMCVDGVIFEWFFTGPVRKAAATGRRDGVRARDGRLQQLLWKWNLRTRQGSQDDLYCLKFRAPSSYAIKINIKKSLFIIIWPVRLQILKKFSICSGSFIAVCVDTLFWRTLKSII